MADGIVVWTGTKKVRHSTIRVGKSDFAAKLQVNQVANLVSTLLVAPYNRMEGEVEVYGRSDKDFKSKLIVRIHNDFKASIKLAPRNRMTGVVDLQPIPRVEETLTTVKDAFYRSGVPRLNYGKEQTMSVGRMMDSPYTADKTETLRTNIQFDLTHLPNNVEIEKAVLRLHATGLLKESIYKVINNREGWEEVTVAWVNQPSVTDDFVEGSSKDGDSLLEIDVAPLVKKWTDNKEGNFGFSVRAMNELQELTQTFYTREYGSFLMRPQLELKYFDRDLIVSLGRTPLRGNLTVKRARESDFKAKIEINSFLGGIGLGGSLVVVRPLELASKLIVSQRSLGGRLPVRQLMPGGIVGTIAIAGEGFEELPSKVAVSRNKLIGSIIVAELSEVNSSITVANQKHSNLPKGTLEVMRTGLVGEGVVKNREDLISSIAIRGNGDTELISGIVVSRPELTGKLIVTAQRSLKSLLHVSKDKDISLGGKIEVRAHSDGIVGSIEVIRASHLAGILTVNSDLIYGGLAIKGFGEGDLKGVITVGNQTSNELVGSITIKERTSLEGTIEIPSRKTLKGKLTVVGTSKLHGKLTTISPYFPGTLAVPGYGDSVLAGEMIVNVRMINEVVGKLLVLNPRNLNSKITIVEGGSYSEDFIYLL